MSLVSILLNKLLIFFSNKNTIRYTKIFSNLSKQDKKFEKICFGNGTKLKRTGNY